jgi:hypothetical protein
MALVLSYYVSWGSGSISHKALSSFTANDYKKRLKPYYAMYNQRLDLQQNRFRFILPDWRKRGESLFKEPTNRLVGFLFGALGLSAVYAYSGSTLSLGVPIFLTH